MKKVKNLVEKARRLVTMRSRPRPQRGGVPGAAAAAAAGLQQQLSEADACSYVLVPAPACRLGIVQGSIALNWLRA